MPKTKKTESKKKDTDSKIKPKKNTSTKVSPKKTKTGASTKAKTTSKSSAKTKAKAKTSTKANVKKTSTKASSAKTKKTTKKASKAKPIIVDIIKDEDLESETFFSDESLEVGEIDLQSAQEFFLDLEEGEVPRESSEEGLVGDEIEEKAQKAWLSNEENDKQKQFYKDSIGR